MTQVANPYQELLGVGQADAHSPSPYALLGLISFENDFAKIRAAADRQRARLERARTRSDREQWERVEADLKQAIRTLLEPSRKAELDLKLKRQAISAEKQNAPAPPPDASGEVRCGGCDRSNAAQKRFCSSCGDPLWIECLGCATLMPQSETFCGGCGENQDDVAARIREQNQAVLDRAASLAEAFRFPEAIAALSPLIQQTNHHLRDQLERAGEMMDAFLAERRQREIQAAGALQEARRLADATRYVEATELLQSVPEPFRDETFRRLLNEVLSKSEEIRRLRTRIADAVKHRRIDEANQMVERLLSLEPGNQEVEKIGISLARSLQQAAVKFLGKHQYSACLNLLNQIPERRRDERIGQLTTKVKELAWLHADLRRSRYADDTLVEVARRLTTLVPDDESTARLRTQLEERMRKYRAAANGQATAPIPWAAQPGPSFLDVPLDWLTKTRGYTIPDAKTRAAWSAGPGCFFVAAGLALRGLGMADLELDLKARKKKTGVLGGLSLGRSGKQRVPAAWGIDLGSSSLKAVRLVARNDTLVVDRCVFLPIERHAALREGDAGSSSVVSQTLRAFRASHEIAADEPVCVNLPMLRLLGRFLRVPRSEGKQFQQVLQYEVRNRIPFPLEELCWDHQVVPDDEATYDKVPQTVLVVAAKQFEVQRWLAHFEETDLRVDHLQFDAVALHNWWRYGRAAAGTPGEQASRQQADVLLDIGSDASQIVVSWFGSFWFRSIATGGDDFTNALVKRFRLTHEQAEELKRRPARAKRLSPVYEAIEPVQVRLRTQIRQSLDAFSQDYPELRLTRAYALGGGIRMHGLLTDLGRPAEEHASAELRD